MRGLASLTVCLFHACGLRAAGVALLPRDTWLRVLFHGRGAVILFFVLSGFALRLSLENKKRVPVPNLSLSYLLGRLFRLYPVIIATTIVIAATRWVFDGLHLSLSEILRHASLLSITYMGHFWTLQVEVFGSLLVLVAFLVERKFGIWGVVLMAAALIPFSFLTHGWFAGRPCVQRLYLFLFGYLVAANPQMLARWAKHSGKLMLGALVIFYGAAMIGNLPKQWLVLLLTISASFIVGIVSVKRYALLEWPAIRVLGILSYSFYAMHWFGLRAALYLAEVLHAKAVPNSVILMTGFVCVVVVTLPIALAMHFLIERPGMTIGYNLRQALKHKSPVSNRPAEVQVDA